MTDRDAAIESLVFDANAYFWLGRPRGWEVKRRGRRLSAHLFLKTSNLRKKHVALLRKDRPFASKLSNGLPVLVELPDAASNGGDRSERPDKSSPIPSVHNVVPFQRVRR